ncbi:tetraacyldisaccharide 4'-kinase [Candidatus Francisella endociliophora]|uniref:Tetraacyldisaccharide 4'-kinase n=1 Tax=Candidatus Francisella endociliophora TaxID=653937 RepID=A0A097EPE5_9GAMM|nr:tetraacyldisaccharide 4'-kinase [Francisella sp. FSC1006]AIT09438.1 tetraacyldisaccharide 4'-kinase [Francisella sp. FSC1006]
MINKIWYRRTPTLLSLLLMPISFLFSKIAVNRKLKQLETQYKSNIPVIIVGNISVGGTGKTPVVRKLAEKYLQEGKKPVIISRGYGAKAEYYPFEVQIDTLPSQCGDEPAMLYDALDGQVPIIISPQRVDSVKYVEKMYPNTDVIISDDGLQHYKLGRDKEIVVVDASRMFGNKLCLPAGPLRESVERLKTVDQIIVVGELDSDDYSFLKSYNEKIVEAKIVATNFVNLVSKEVVDGDSFYGKEVSAVAGIGNPDKFFNTLGELGVNTAEIKVFKDHHKYKPSDFDSINCEQPLIMTYKDAIKCKSFADDNWWYLDIQLLCS